MPKQASKNSKRGIILGGVLVAALLLFIFWPSKYFEQKPSDAAGKGSNPYVIATQPATETSSTVAKTDSSRRTLHPTETGDVTKAAGTRPTAKATQSPMTRPKATNPATAAKPVATQGPDAGSTNNFASLEAWAKARGLTHVEILDKKIGNTVCDNQKGKERPALLVRVSINPDEVIFYRDINQSAAAVWTLKYRAKPGSPVIDKIPTATLQQVFYLYDHYAKDYSTVPPISDFTIQVSVIPR